MIACSSLWYHRFQANFWVYITFWRSSSELDTVGMVGVLAGTIEDAFIVYVAISGKIPTHQPTTSMPPKVYFPLLKSGSSISNIKMAKYGEWFNDSSDDVRICCSHAMDQLHKNYGWEFLNEQKLQLLGVSSVLIAAFFFVYCILIVSAQLQGEARQNWRR